MLNDWLTESTDLDSTDALSRRRHADQPNRRPTQNRTLSPHQNHPPPARSPIVVTRDFSLSTKQKAEPESEPTALT